jgi:hypothetical protein
VEVVETDVQRRIFRGRLGDFIRLNVQAEQAAVNLGEILDKEFWDSMLIIVRHSFAFK